MIYFFKAFGRNLGSCGKDLLPVVLVIGCFQFFLGETALVDFKTIILGSFLVLLGLSLFVFGFELCLLPLGRGLAYDFIKKGSLFWLLAFGATLGFGTTLAEPTLIAVAQKAAVIAEGEGYLEKGQEIKAYANSLRLWIATAIAISVVLGVFRIVKRWPLQRIVVGGYGVIIFLSYFAPAYIIGIAYDAGGVATSTLTVPLIAALGVGLASSIRGAHPLTDGFGMIALACLSPIIAVLLFGIIG